MPGTHWVPINSEQLWSRVVLLLFTVSGYFYLLRGDLTSISRKCRVALWEESVRSIPDTPWGGPSPAMSSRGMAGHRSEEHLWLSDTGVVSGPAVFGKRKKAPSIFCVHEGGKKVNHRANVMGLMGFLTGGRGLLTIHCVIKVGTSGNGTKYSLLKQVFPRKTQWIYHSEYIT